MFNEKVALHPLNNRSYNKLSIFMNDQVHCMSCCHLYNLTLKNILGDRRRKTKLSVLTQLFLNRSIQTHGKEGHNPIEDAQAAMSLVNLKLEKGLSFGDVVLGRGLFFGFKPK